MNYDVFHVKTLKLFYLAKNNSLDFDRSIWLSPSSFYSELDLSMLGLTDDTSWNNPCAQARTKVLA